MSDDFLSRWSRRKVEARRKDEVLRQETAEDAGPTASTAPSPTSETLPAVATSPDATPIPTPVALPPVESLTSESDFAPFMRPDVDAGLRRQALKTLFGDPRFNVMDGLDVYIDDYSKPDPLPAGWLEKMEQVARLGVYQPPVEAPEAQAIAADPLEADLGASAAPAPEPAPVDSPANPADPA